MSLSRVSDATKIVPRATSSPWSKAKKRDPGDEVGPRADGSSNVLFLW